MAQLDGFLHSARMRARAAVRCGQSPLTAMVVAASGNNVYAKSSWFLNAFSAVDANERGWVSALGLIAMSRAIHMRDPSYGEMSEADRDAFYFGSLTALWQVPEDNIVPEKIIESRDNIIKALRLLPPSGEEVKVAINGWISIYQQKNANIYHRGAHMFPIALSAGLTDELIQQTRPLCYGPHHDDNPEIVSLTNEQIIALRMMKPKDQITAIWNQLHDVHIIAYYTVLGSTDPTYGRDQMRAMFTQIATIGKSSFTEAWARSRWQNLVQDEASLANSPEVSRDTLISYATKFQSLASDGIKVAGLLHNYYLAKSVNMTSLTRIIEQSRAPHVSGLTALCEMMIRYVYATYTGLQAVFGDSQLKPIVKLAAHIIYNPFCTLSGPPITQAFYADVAYVATELMYHTNRNPNKGQRYNLPSTSHLTKAIPFLNSYIESLTQIESRGGEVTQVLQTVLGAYNKTLRPGANGEWNVTDQGMEAQAELIPINREQVLSSHQLSDLIISLRNDKDKAFFDLMVLLKDAIAQQPFNEVTVLNDEWVHPRLTVSPLSDGVKALITTLGVEVDPKWNVETNIVSDARYANYIIANDQNIRHAHQPIVGPVAPGDDEARPPLPQMPPPPRDQHLQ
ncbi:putative nucleoprotein [Shayang Fly Virus 1]|uniref:Putative nucleoprotein n=1 Tax=Shayang Fly Virus 1 TaxID=1608065 RepID=A0A0B5KX82_9VIRU|nr:putative nucleoprotein [Shayang Fly Virus 1]AJG39053.1 putative nucleoprotein [Shayang Fly Virus 1]